MCGGGGGWHECFRHTKITLQNFGILKGPTITHFPLKVPTRSWFDIVEAENESLAHMTQMANVIVSSTHDFRPSSMLLTPALAFQPGIDTFVHEMCVSEELSRTLLYLKLLKERAQLTGSPHATHCTSHLLSPAITQGRKRNKMVRVCGPCGSHALVFSLPFTCDLYIRYILLFDKVRTQHSADNSLDRAPSDVHCSSA